MGRLASALDRVSKLTGLDARIDNSEGALTAEQIRVWREDGYLLLPGHFSSKRTDAINGFIDDLWANRRRPDNPLVIDVFLYTPEQRRIYMRDAPDEARDHPYKLNDLYLEHEIVRQFVLDAGLAAALRALLRGDPMVFNGLTFERGSQQDFHFDTFYMPPPVKDKMAASWIALEDIHPDAGPLAYYPGSHKIPPYIFSNGKLNAIPEEMPRFREYIARELEKRGMRPVEFTPKRGDVFVWHAQLLHGGSPIKDPARTRKSLVSHYFRARDFKPWCSREVEPGRYCFVRGHQKVDDGA